MGALAMSRHLSFHARGDAAFVWHGLTGDVAEMSRDVLALLLAFDPRADEAVVRQAPPAGLGPEQVEEFVPVLRSRRFLVASGPGGNKVDEYAPLLAGHPRVPRNAVFHRRGDQVTVYARRAAIDLDPRTAGLFLRCDGERTLGQVLGDAGPAALPPLLRLARADVAALKVLAKAVSHGGVALNPAAESTMPYPELRDPHSFAAGGPAPALTPRNDGDDADATLADLFRETHPALKGRTFAAALAEGLLRRGALQEAKGRRARVLVTGAPRSELARALPQSLSAAATSIDSETSPLPAAPADSLDLVVSSEEAGSLGTGPQDGRLVNHGAVALVRHAAAALAPGGTVLVVALGDPKADPVEADSGSWSVRFSELQSEATRLGLRAQVLPIAELLSLDGAPQALSTTRASFPALRSLFAAHGLRLRHRAWLRAEIEALCAGKLDLSEVHGLQWTPLAERTMELSPRQFWALFAQKPERVLH